MKIFFAMMAIVILMSGCGCEADLTIHVTPVEKQLKVGESFTPTVRYAGCRDTEPLSDVVTWRSADTTIATTNSTTGLTTAGATGVTNIPGTGALYWTQITIALTESQ